MRPSPAAYTRTRPAASERASGVARRCPSTRPSCSRALVALIGVWLLVALAAPSFAVQAAGTLKPSRALLRDDGFCLGCHAPGSLARGAVEVEAGPIAGSMHGDVACADCHVDVIDVPHSTPPARVDCGACHEQGAPWARHPGRAAPAPTDLHRSRQAAGAVEGPRCISCHGGHSANAADWEGSRLGPKRIAETCGACHAKESHQYAASVHGIAASKGNHDVPTCATCHPEHTSLAVKNVARRGVVNTCVSCHDDPGLQRKYALPANRLASYLGSYHGAASELGDNQAANCASCHGVHDILPSSDPRSPVNPHNMGLTCGKCHPGAMLRFGKERVHLQPSLKHDRFLFFVRTGYQLFIIGLMSSFLSYIGLELAARCRRRFPPSSRPPSGEPEPEYERLSLNQRIQHWVLIAVFITLLATGLPLTSPGSAVSRGLVVFVGGMGARAVIHRVAALVLIGLVGYHMLYLTFSPQGHRDSRELMPARQDGLDVLHMLRFYLGFASVPARFGRYNYIEKLEYLAVGWGSLVMIGTGLLLWRPGVSLSLFPKWVMDVALVVHSWEAIMAFLAVLIWHMYNVHLNPSVFPMSRVWLTGRISRHELKDSHAREYDRMLLGRRQDYEEAR